MDDLAPLARAETLLARAQETARLLPSPANSDRLERRRHELAQTRLDALRADQGTQQQNTGVAA